MEMTVRNFKWHAAEISRQFGIVVVYEERLARDQAMVLRLRGELLGPIDRLMGLKEGVVFARPIDDDTSYAVVMHEVGHHVAPNGYCLLPEPKPGCHTRDRFEYAAAKLVAEEAAWEWARYYVEQVFVWTIGMESVYQSVIRSYVYARRTGR